MTNIEARAAETVNKIMAEGNEALDAFATYEVNPYEFDWGWAGKIGESDYIYKRRDLGKVQGRAAKEQPKGRRAGGTRATRAATIAQMNFDCPTCHQVHSVLAACEG